jgi:hypothetical protein
MYISLFISNRTERISLYGSRSNSIYERKKGWLANVHNGVYLYSVDK